MLRRRAGQFKCVPEFEVARVEAETTFDRVASYPEYPGEEHPMRILAGVLAEMGVAGTIAADQDGYPGILGYDGPALSEVSGAAIVPLAPALESLMARKSDAEVELVRESARWCGHAHRLLQEHTRPGVTEAHAIQAGREVRVMVDAKKISDEESHALAFNIAKRVSEEMTFPGEIRVTVLRETRAVEFAR